MPSATRPQIAYQRPGRPIQGGSADELLTAKEVAGILKCSVSRVYELHTKDKALLPRYKLFGGKKKGWRWSHQDVLGYVSACTLPGFEPKETPPPFVHVTLQQRPAARDLTSG